MTKKEENKYINLLKTHKSQQIQILQSSKGCIYLLKAYTVIALSTTQGHLRAFHKFNSHTS